MVDEDGFDYMKVSFLRDIKAQQRSLRFVSLCHLVYFSDGQFYLIQWSLLINLAYVETIQRPMLGPNIMTKRNPGMKGVMSHLLVLHKMKLANLMPLIWLIRVVVY